jgi:hypothetical protein
MSDVISYADVPVTPEEETVWTAAEWTDTYLRAMTFWISWPLTLATLSTQSYSRDPEQWPFRLKNILGGSDAVTE